MTDIRRLIDDALVSYAEYNERGTTFLRPYQAARAALEQAFAELLAENKRLMGALGNGTATSRNCGYAITASRTSDSKP